MSDAPRPEVLAGLVQPGLPAAVAQRLLASSRLGGRVRRLAAAAVDAGHAAGQGLDPATAALARGDAALLRRARILAGALWQARRIRGMLRGAEVAEFEAEFGGEARALALALGGEAPAETGTEPLSEAIPCDGAALMLAWREALPPAVVLALRLHWPLPEPDLAQDDPRRLAAPVILAHVARHLAATAA